MLPLRSTTREWGDGLTTRSRHIIADITYGPSRSAILCSDGAVLEATTPEGLEARWQEHGGVIMKPEADDRAQPEPFIDLGRSAAAMNAILAVGRACTCSPGSDITTCPNYEPSMDDGMEDE